MGQKVYYDSVNNKEVIDVSGAKDEAKVKADFALDPSVQVMVIDTDAEEIHYVDAGVLKKKTKAEQDTEEASKKSAKNAAKATKKNKILSKLKIDEDDLDDLKAALS